jgi:hypothetical protein
MRLALMPSCQSLRSSSTRSPSQDIPVSFNRNPLRVGRDDAAVTDVTISVDHEHPRHLVAE